MNEYEEFLNGIAAVIGIAGALGMLVCVIRSAIRDHRRLTLALQGIDGATGGTAAPLQAPAPAQRSGAVVLTPPGAPKRELLIIKCSDSLMWYAGKVGQRVPYIRTIPSEGIHISREPAGYTNIVKMSDAVFINEDDK